MVLLASLLACVDGGPDGAGPGAPPPGPGGPGGPAAPAGRPDAGAQAARAAPTVGTPWDGPWTVTVYAPDPADPGARALGEGLALPVQAWTGGRPRTRPGEAALLWLAPGDLDATALALAPQPGPQGDVVAVLAPGDPAWSARAAERLPWASVALVDPVISATRWLDAPIDASLAGRLAAREVADHYGVPYHPTTTALPPGLDALLGPFDAALLASADPRTRAEAVRAAAAAPATSAAAAAPATGAAPATLATPATGAAPGTSAAPTTLATPGTRTTPGTSATPATRATASPADRVDALAADPSVAVRLAVADVTRDPATRARLAADPDPTVRARAADELDDVALLARLAEDPSSVVRVVATHRLAHLAGSRPTEVAPALRRAATASDAYQRWKAAWGLGRVPGSVDALVPLLDDPDIDVRREAARSLGRLRDPAAVEPLLEALRDDNSFVRRWAAAALGDLRDPRARDALREAAGKPTTLVAQAAARALGALGERVQPPPFTPPGKPRDDAALDALVESRDATVRKDAAKFLAGRDDPADVARLARLVADRDSEVRKSAVEAMGWNEATAALATPFLADPDPDVRVTALDALRRGSAGSVDAIAPLLAERDTEVRLRAAEALAGLGPSDALASLLGDPDERVRAAAAAVYPDRVARDEPSALVRRAAGRPDPDPVVAAPKSPLASWADGVFAREDDLLHLRFSWNEDADRPSAYRALRPPVIRAYGHPDRG